MVRAEYKQVEGGEVSPRVGNLPDKTHRVGDAESCGLLAQSVFERARTNDGEQTISGDSRLYSLVAGVSVGHSGEGNPTYQITRGLPLGQSYAREIARRHGISLEQILANRKID